MNKPRDRSDIPLLEGDADGSSRAIELVLSREDEDPLVSRAKALLGTSLTQFILENARPRKLGSTGAAHAHLADNAIANAVQIASELEALEAKSTIQAWFAGKNQFLGGRAPASVILTDAPAVRRAARRFMAQG